MSEERWIASKHSEEVAALSRRYVDLAHPRLGTRALSCSDDFFAPMSRLLSPEPAIFVPDKYDDNGKWMDGWESRRKRVSGHDWCIIQLGAPGKICAFDIDTSHFTGNFPPAASIEGCIDPDGPGENTKWHPLVEKMDLAGDSHHVVEVKQNQIWTGLRLNIFPDGGIARLRIFGEIYKDWDGVDADETLDMLALVNGGTAVAWNDAHFGVPANMIAPGPGVNMGDGWETARRRQPGNDWSILKLGHRGQISEVVVDTAYFKGNYPDRCRLSVADIDGDLSTDEIIADSENWQVLLDEQKLSADAKHVFNSALNDVGPFTHVRLDIYPDGGVSRLRMFGKKV